MCHLLTIGKSIVILSLLINVISINTSLYEKIYLKSPRYKFNNYLNYIFGKQLDQKQDPKQVPFESKSSLILSSIITFRHGERTTGKGGVLNNFKNIN